MDSKQKLLLKKKKFKNKYFIDVKENMYRVRHANTMHVTVPNQPQKLQKIIKRTMTF